MDQDSLQHEMTLQDRGHAQSEIRDGRTARVVYLSAVSSIASIVGVASFFSAQVLFILWLFPYLFTCVAGMSSHTNEIVDSNKGFLRETDAEYQHKGHQDYMDAHKHERTSGGDLFFLRGFILIFQVILILLTLRLVYPDLRWIILMVIVESGSLIGTWKKLHEKKVYKQKEKRKNIDDEISCNPLRLD